MLMHNINKVFAYCFVILLLSSCAIIVKPTGGPKDVTPPKVLNYSPENKSLHFTGKKIRITFDEYIQLKNLDKQLIVSPPLKYAPVAIMKGKVMEITIKDTLKEGTTYTFNFGNAITDNNEGNAIRNFQYVVSTGDHLDSLSITGNLQDAFTHDPIKGGYVMLYLNQDDSAIYKKVPEYIGLADDNGNYRIDNIAAGTYRLIGISNLQGTDYFYHPYVEGIGFRSKLTEIDGHDTANLNVFYEPEPKLKLLKAKAVDRGQVMLAFNDPVTNLSVKPLYLADSLKPVYSYINYSVTADTAFYWLNTPFLDSLRLIVYNNNQVIDTAFVHSFPNNSTTRNVKKPKLYKLKINSNVHTGFDYHQPISFTFGDPVLKYNMSKVFLTQNKDTIKFSVDTSKLPLAFNINPAKTLLSDSTYKLVMLPGAFTDMFGTKNDTTKTRFNILEPTYFGTLKLSIKLPEQGHYIVQLLTDKNSVYLQQTITGSKQVIFDPVLPGNYRMRIIDDANNNGTWDPGNFMQNLQPEKVYYYSDPITIRSNWDLAQSWKV
ncbi:MAG TPA: Ig-like domain-containing domain, partial [Bacteroidia bacterium]|nr:Ig-like domain-containing domain [Bacteroidia bacterium]